MIDRDALLERLQPIVDQLFAQLAELVPALVREQLGELVAKLAGGIEAPTPKRERNAPKRERKVAHRDVKPEKVNPRVCGKCEQPGHNARSCGRAPKSRGTDPVEPDESPPQAPPPLLEPTASPPSKRLLASVPRKSARPAPPAWSIEQDRRDENDELSSLTVNRKTR